MDDLTTLRAEGWLEGGRVLQLLKVVLVGAVPDVHLGLERVAAFLAVFPVASMSFVVMKPAEGVAIVVPAAAIPRIRERDVLFMVVAYPIPAAIGLSDLTGFATQSTARLLTLGLRCRHLFPRMLWGSLFASPVKVHLQNQNAESLRWVIHRTIPQYEAC